MRELLYRIKETVSPSPIPPWVQIAKREIGVKEWRGAENPRILEYFKATNLAATEDEVPWCSAFMNWVMREAHMQRTYSAAARSWLGCGERLSGFRKYAIVVFKRGGSPWQGHVALAMTDVGGGYINCLGGNQGDEVSYGNFPKSNVLGYMWPTPEGG